jgi:acetoacetyl-CoA reductase/3-oxoacyl-[acyl-carrier protein] reductase
MDTTQQREPEPSETLKGRVALVTGGTRGIGAAISRRLAEQGAHVAAAYGSNRARADEFQAELARDGWAISVHEGDVGSAEDCRRTVREVAERHGRLDILVNNAGITADRTIFKMDDDDWYKVLAVNLSGAFFTAQAALEHMVEQGSGRIINISSIIGQIGNVGQINYAASKSGMFGLTMSLAREAAFALKRADKLTPDGINITVNAIAPGFIDVGMSKGMPDEVTENFKKQIPLGRLGDVQEIVNAALFLASPMASYITGHVLNVNGGYYMG